MNCSEVQELLSAYYDGELNETDRAEVSRHFSECSQCEAELAGFQHLSVLANGLAAPSPPDDGWKQIEQQLDRRAGTVKVSETLPDPRKSYHLVTLAVSIVVVIGISFLVYRANSHSDKATQFAADFNRYLNKFQSDPDAAQELLLANYEHWKVVPTDPVEQINYRPAIAKGLPENYTAESTYVFKMPCCTCVQSLCTRKDGTKLAIFEYDDEETDHWFGNRTRINVVCHGKKCCLVELGDQLAATWKHGNRYISLIGVRDVSEVDEFIVWITGDDNDRDEK